MPLAGGAIAHVHVNWLSPTKIRQMVIGGTQRTLVWDDLNPQQRVSVYDRGVDLDTESKVTTADARAANISYRLGDTWAPALPEREALAGVVAEFAASIRERRARARPAEMRACACCRCSRRRPRACRRPAPRRPIARRISDGGSVMTRLEGARVLVTGGAGTIGSTIVDQLARRRARRTSTCSTTSSAAASPTSTTRWPPGGCDLVEGDIRDARLVDELTAGKDVVFHQAAIRITQCAEEPRLALEVLVDGTFNVVEAAARHRWASSSRPPARRSTAWPRSSRPTERHHHHNNDTLYGAAKSFNEGLIRSFRAMYGLDYVILRYFNVYGPRMDVHGLYTEVLVRWMERIADGKPPLIFGDGTQTMDFVCVPDIARANVLAAQSDVVDGDLQHRQRHRDEPARARRGAAAGHGLRPRRRARARARGQRRHATPRRHHARRSATSASTPRSTSRRACACSSTGGAPLRDEIAAGTDGERVDERPHQRHGPVARPGGGRCRRRGRSRAAGSPRARASRSSSRSSREAMQAPLRRRDDQLHDRAAPRADRRRHRSRRRRRRAVVLVHRHDERRALRRREPGVRRRRPDHRQPHAATRCGRRLTPATPAVIASTRAACRSTSTTSARSPIRAASS